MLLASKSLFAVDLDIQPSLEQDETWESNPLMIVGNTRPTLFGSVTTPKITVTDKSPNTTLDAGFWVNEGIFNQPGFNSTDFHSNVNFDQKIDRWEAGFQEQTDYDTTRTSELTPINTNTIGAVRHTGNTISPVISFNETLADKFSLAGSYSESKYDSDLYTNYHTVSATPSYQHSFTPLEAGVISVQTQEYETDSGTALKVDSVQPAIGWVSNPLQNLTIKATAGIQATRQQGIFIPKQDWTWSGIYNADITYKSIADNVEFGAGKSLQPYPNGQEFYLNTLTLTETHTINSLFSANIQGSYQFANNSSQNSTNLKALSTAGGGITYHVTNRFDLTGSYQYRDESFTNINQNAYDSLFTVGLVYHPQLENIKW